MPAIQEGDLTRVIRTWPRLPPETRGYILSLVEEATTMQPNAITSELILAAALAIEPAFNLPGGPLVHFVHLRRHATLKALPKPVFDQAVIHLAQTSGRVALHHHDHAARLREDERRVLVTDGERYFVGLSTK